jgi:hypothetical protein
MRALLAALALSTLVACSATANRTSGTTSGSGASTSSGPGTGTGTGGSGAGTGTGTGGLTVGTASTGSGTGGGLEIAEVFGQSADTLYKLDPNTKMVTTVGPFQNCDSAVIDIALDKDGNMFGTTTAGVYRIDKTTAACSLITFGTYPNSLSFVPAGTLDPSLEALVGYNGSIYVRIDTTTGKVTQVGSLGNSGYQSSGDVVSVIGGGTYLTVNGNGCGDCIVEVDPKTGALKKMIGPVGHSQVFGLAFWGGSAYGFDNGGQLFQIDLTSGMSTIINIPSAPPGLSFYGAGSTTSAPLTPTQ